MFVAFYKKLAAFAAVLLTLVLLAVPAYALNPATGDGSTHMMLYIVGGLLVLCAVLVVIYFVLSAKSKNKHK